MSGAINCLLSVFFYLVRSFVNSIKHGLFDVKAQKRIFIIGEIHCIMNPERMQPAISDLITNAVHYIAFYFISDPFDS